MLSSEVALIKSNNDKVCYFSHSCEGIKLLHDAEGCRELEEKLVDAKKSGFAEAADEAGSITFSWNPLRRVIISP